MADNDSIKDGDTEHFIRAHMRKEWQPVTIRMPHAGWFNLALDRAGLDENRDYFIIPWDAALPEDAKRLFAGQGDCENILFVIKLSQEDAETACRMAEQEPRFIKDNEELMTLTCGACGNEMYGFAPVGAGYVSVNSADVRKVFDNAVKSALGRRI